MRRMVGAWGPAPKLLELLPVLLLVVLEAHRVHSDVYNSASQLASVMRLERKLVELATELHREEPHAELDRSVDETQIARVRSDVTVNFR